MSYLEDDLPPTLSPQKEMSAVTITVKIKAGIVFLSTPHKKMSLSLVIGYWEVLLINHASPSANAVGNEIKYYFQTKQNVKLGHSDTKHVLLIWSKHCVYSEVIPDFSHFSTTSVLQEKLTNNSLGVNRSITPMAIPYKDGHFFKKIQTILEEAI